MKGLSGERVYMYMIEVGVARVMLHSVEVGSIIHVLMMYVQANINPFNPIRSWDRRVPS